MELIKEIPMEATVDKVWEVFAHKFNECDAYLASVPKSYAADEANEGEEFEGAKSRGRIVNMDGTSMRALERFVAYDETAKTCSIKVDFLDAPGIFPFRFFTLNFSVVAGDGDNSTNTKWVFGANLKPLAYLLYPLLRFGMFKGWSEMAEEFQYYVEKGTPHPRKVAALEKANANKE